MVVEDLDDLGLLDAGHALRLLGVVDEQDATRRRVDEVGAGDQPDRMPARVDRDGRAVVDLLDLVGDVGEQVVRAHRQRLAVDQRAAGRRQRDHAGGHVAVQRRADHRDSALDRERERVVGGRRAVARHEQADAELDRRPLRVVAVADDHDVARPRSRSAASRRPSPGTRSARRSRRRRRTRARPAARARSRSRGSARRARTARATRGCSAAPASARSSRPASAPSPSTTGTRSRSSRAISRPTSRTGSPSPACGNSRRMTSLDPQHHVLQEVGLARAGALEHPARLLVDLPEPHRHVGVARVDAAHQLGVADGRRDRVRVRVAVARDVDARNSAMPAE